MPITLLLRCNDQDATREFYRSVLAFNVADSAEGTLTVDKHGSRLIFTRQDLWKSGPVFSGTIYFPVPDLDGYYAAIRDRTSISWPLQDMPYGSREFGILDCNGYYLGFQQQA